jgi:Sortilin, neurotensin receptor 3,
MSYEGEAYVSRNHGNKWQNIQPLIKKSTNTLYGISWKFSSMIQSPGDHDNIIISSETRNNWVTKDCGETWKLIDDGLNLFGFKYHPHLSGKVLALSRRLCAATAPLDCIEYNNLHLSEDYGFTWRVIETFVYDYIWGREAHYSYGIGENAIFITK